MLNRESVKILSIVPGRGGSKGLSNKVRKELNGRPMFSYPLSEALESEYVDNMRVIVDSDDEEVLGLGREYGAETPYVRPEHLGGDSVSVIAVYKYAVNWFRENESYFPDIVVGLQSNVPLVQHESIDLCITNVLYHGCDSSFTMYKCDIHPHRLYYLEDDNKVVFSEYTSENPVSRQARRNLYKMDGAVIARKVDLLDQWNNDSFALGENKIATLVPKIQTVDVHDEFDFAMAETLLKLV